MSAHRHNPTAASAATAVDEVQVRAWAAWFDALPAEERAVIEAMAERDRKYGGDFEREAVDLAAESARSEPTR